MDTLVFHQEIGCCADIIRQGGLVSVPTETVYGLAGDALNTDAVRKIYEVKGRPPVKPLSIMIRGREDIPRYASQVPPRKILHVMEQLNLYTTTTEPTL